MHSLSTHELFLQAFLRVGLSASCLESFSFPFHLCIPFSSCYHIHTPLFPAFFTLITLQYQFIMKVFGFFLCMEVFHTRGVDSNRVSFSIAQRGFLFQLALRILQKTESTHCQVKVQTYITDTEMQKQVFTIQSHFLRKN